MLRALGVTDLVGMGGGGGWGSQTLHCVFEHFNNCNYIFSVITHCVIILCACTEFSLLISTPSTFNLQLYTLQPKRNQVTRL